MFSPRHLFVNCNCSLPFQFLVGQRCRVRTSEKMFALKTLKTLFLVLQRVQAAVPFCGC